MNQTMLLALVIWPMVASLLSAFFRGKDRVITIATWSSIPFLILGLWVAVSVFSNGPLLVGNGLLRVDALSAILVMIISGVGFSVLQYSAGYIRREVLNRNIQPTRVWSYYMWLYLFLMTMIVTCVVDNLGVMWVAIEATTLTSAVLVAFYSRPASLEAAWKYIILCSVGIALAFFGIILAYSSSVHALGERSGALQWTVLRLHAVDLDPKQMRLAFIFILAGFGAKAGLVPMHTWLPDAYSQSPSPIAALLSSTLSFCALYGLIRFHAIYAAVPGNANANAYLMFFGVLSILVAVPFIFLQGDLKRLLAYSSVESIGFIVLGIGIGGFWSIYGALFHMVGNAFAKATLFLTSGSMIQEYNSRRISRIGGALQTLPASGALFGLAILAVAGMPGFSSFISEFLVIGDGIQSGQYLAVLLGLAGLVTAFAGMAFHSVHMIFGHASGRAKKSESFADWWPAGLLLVVLVIMGFWIPDFLREGLSQATYIIHGGRAR